ncbi:tyrosine-protein phosphatase [Jeotgalibacillus soli]|uniref:Tyrosine-protein phosphatase n=1 Tax=Jeotgalibacillus soli TaxID=889306 RepID=A0A0C2S772_9BACL|nr:CpsB/CapC family capsule biosynthesis tyrosine phosphatase [Jeotgalibacillus soli]KIL49874.1 protein-tyrosine-phosphatase [Jeotgalibacillus soli]
MIDIHCHILPGVDDGPAHFENTLEMIYQAMEDGITDIIATPHHRNRHYVNPMDEVLQHVQKLNGLLKERELPVTIHPGQEVRLYGELLEDFRNGDILSLGGQHSYILIELPTSQVPAYTERIVYEMLVEGLLPIIAHPERNSAIVESPDKLFQLINQGATSQVTAASVAGDFGKKLQRFSFELLENSLAHFVASDAHDIKNRGFALNRAVQTLHSTYGNDFQVMENARCVLYGEQLSLRQPTPLQSKGFWAKLLNRS